MQSHVSDIVLSLSGRDKGKAMLVVREDEQYLYLANGKGRRAEKPKRKKRKHTAYQAACDEWTRERLFVNGRLTNSEIRKALALWAGKAGEGAQQEKGTAPQSN